MPADPRRLAVSDVDEGVDALLMDGRIVQVRPVFAGDEEALRVLYSRASPRSRYLRFFSAGISVDREVQRLVMPGDDHVALVAEHGGLVVGVASYEVLNGGEAELAILVDDAWQGDGIGSLLIEHLAAVARRAGIHWLTPRWRRQVSSCEPMLGRDKGRSRWLLRGPVRTKVMLNSTGAAINTSQVTLIAATSNR